MTLRRKRLGRRDQVLLSFRFQVRFRSGRCPALIGEGPDGAAGRMTPQVAQEFACEQRVEKADGQQGRDREEDEDGRTPWEEEEEKHGGQDRGDG